MQSNKYQKLGIKQVIRLEWMDKTLRMLVEGYTTAEIRKELDQFLSTQKQSGGFGDRGKKTYGLAIGILSCWFEPDKDCLLLRDDLLSIAKKLSEKQWLPLHWAIICSTYPFWFHLAKQTGRVLNLQEQITKKQIDTRIKEEYGDRETVSRNARYTIRSFIAWKVLSDLGGKGNYTKENVCKIENQQMTVLLIESALHTTPDGKGTLQSLIAHPAFFPFQLPVISSNIIGQYTKRIEVVKSGLDDDLLVLRNGENGFVSDI